MKDKMKKFFKKLPGEVLHLFGIMMMVFLVSALINGVESFSVYRIAQLFGIAVLGGVLILTAFSDIFFKKISYILRICIFIVPFFFISLGFAVAFSWFTSANIMNWVIFIGIFLFCFALSIVIYLITLKVKGKEYTEKLKEYQNKNNDDVNMY